MCEIDNKFLHGSPNMDANTLKTLKADHAHFNVIFTIFNFKYNVLEYKAKKT